MSTTKNDVSTQKLLEDLQTLVRDGEELLRQGAGEITEHGREKLHDAVEAARATAHRIKERAFVGARAADHAVRDHPYQSIGIAFGLGLLIGVLVNRK